MSDKHDTILVYACRHSAYRAADEAGRKRLTYSPRVEIVPLPCSGAVSVHEIILSLENEADGVIIMGCNQGSCHHQNGNHWAEQRAGEVRKKLDQMGMNQDKVQFINIGPDNAHQFVKAVEQMIISLEEGSSREAAG